MKKLYAVGLGLLLSFNCLAKTTSTALYGQEWIGPYTVDKAAFYVNSVYFVFTMHVKENLNTQCAETNKDKKFTRLNTSTSDFINKLYTVAATAQAQGKKVNLLATKQCNSEYGMVIDGIEIVSD